MPELLDRPRPVKESVVFANPEVDDPFNPAEFSFVHRGSRVRLSPEGRGTLLQGAEPVRAFTLPLPPDHRIEWFLYGATGDDIIFVLQLGVGDSLIASVCRFDIKTNVEKWSAVVPGFNIGEPLTVGTMLYVSALGFVGKLDMESGTYLWQHNGLYNDGVYNAFQKPWVSTGTVIFTELSNLREGDDALYVRVDDESGQLLDVWRPAR
jgi:outer membrane protein assembly factor BamB